MVVVGLIMLLPGLCALIFGVDSLTNSSLDPTVMVLVLLDLFIGFLGITLPRHMTVLRPATPGLAPNSADQMSNNPLFFGVF